MQLDLLVHSYSSITLSFFNLVLLPQRDSHLGKREKEGGGINGISPPSSFCCTFHPSSTSTALAFASFFLRSPLPFSSPSHDGRRRLRRTLHQPPTTPTPNLSECSQDGNSPTSSHKPRTLLTSSSYYTKEERNMLVFVVLTLDLSSFLPIVGRIMTPLNSTARRMRPCAAQVTPAFPHL